MNFLRRIYLWLTRCDVCRKNGCKSEKCKVENQELNAW